MSRLEWLRRTFIDSGTSLLKCRKSLSKNGMHRRKSVSPSIVEGLEDRTLLTLYMVNTTSDDADDAAGNADGLLSLREAITAANTNAAFGDAPAGMATGDSISFDPNVFTGPEAARTINIQNGVFVITDDLRITGTAPDVILNAGGGDRIFRIANNQLTVLTDLTLRNAASGDGAGGGAIRITGGGRTILGRVTIENSTAAGRGGGILVISSTLELVDSKILDNMAGTGGGIANVLGVVTLTRTLVDGNTSTAEGGGLSNDGGRLILRDSVISNNTTNVAPGLRGGGGVHNINNGRLAITGSTLQGNRAPASRGGGIFSASGGVTIDDSTISTNFAELSGGGIEIVSGQLIMAGSQLGGPGDGAGNSAGSGVFGPSDGGGLHLSGTARVEIEDSRIMFNEATGEGGGLWNAPQGTLIVRGGSAPVLTSLIQGLAFDPMTLQPIVDQYRATLGTNNGGVPGSQGTGRREINWDGAPDTVATPNFLPSDFFNGPMAPLARGAEFTTPGDGFQVSATAASAVGTVFSNFNPNYAQTFQTFSAERLFSPVSSNVTIVNFFIPGTNTPAVVQGFGAVFTDVDLAGATTIEYFDVNGKLLLSQAVPEFFGQQSLSFLGATFSFPAIAQVRITTGTGILGPKDVSQNGPSDIVVMDDFIFGEPVTFASVDTNTLIRGNKAHGDDADQGGGGIFNDRGRLAVDDVVLLENLADGVRGSGGGIMSTGGLFTINASTLSGNEAARAGGGIEVIRGTALLTDTILGGPNVQDGNEAGLLPFRVPMPGNGGGLHVTGPAFVRITGGSVHHNVAANEGGGLWNAPNSVMVVDGTDISDNVALGDAANNGGGGIFNKSGRLIINNATLSGNRADGDSGSGGGLFNDAGSVTITNTTFSQNSANRAGGGIEVRAGLLVLQDSTLSGNNAGDATGGTPGNGGGLHVTGTSRVDIFGGLFDSNLAANEGGGLWNSSTGLMILHGGTAIRNNVAVGDDMQDGGGGIFNDGGRLAIARAEISGNQAFGTGSTGGGLLSVAGGVSIENSTISGNTSNSAGGGIANFGSLISTNNTIVLNVSNADGTQINGGGVYTATGAFTSLRNTIVAGNRSQIDTRGRPTGSDLGGPGSVAAAFNLIGNAASSAGIMDGVNGNIVGVGGVGTIDLATVLDRNLANNGGPTRTHALTFTSPAINSGSNALAVGASGQPLTTDQRGPGFPRIFNSTVDLGAFER